MSPKELLYLDDALSHEQAIQQRCCELAKMVQDRELKAFVQQLASRHQKNFGDLFGLLN